MSGSKQITTKQRELLNNLLAGKTVSRAAELAGVSERQSYRWIRDDETFKGTLTSAQRVKMDAVGVRLLTLADDALDVLRDLIADPPLKQDAPGAGVQLRAALAVLDTSLKWREAVDFESRLSELERRLSG